MPYQLIQPSSRSFGLESRPLLDGSSRASPLKGLSKKHGPPYLLSKPWRYTGKEENMQREDIKMLVKKWWDIYNDESLDYKKKAAGGVVGPAAAAGGEGVNMQPFIEALSEAGVVQYMTAPSLA